MVRLRGQALLIRSSSSPLTSFCRSISFQSPCLRCYSTKPLVSFQGIKIASQSSDTKLVSTSRSRLSSSSGFVRASHQASDAGSIDASTMQSMENKIKELLNADTVIVKDAYGDGLHVSIYVVSSAFEGQSAVNRQRMVYKAIWEELQSTVHAVDQMITNTPIEANKK